MSYFVMPRDGRATRAVSSSAPAERPAELGKPMKHDAPEAGAPGPADQAGATSTPQPGLLELQDAAGASALEPSEFEHGSLAPGTHGDAPPVEHLVFDLAAGDADEEEEDFFPQPPRVEAAHGAAPCCTRNLELDNEQLYRLEYTVVHHD